jgi:hypothetical protein
LFAVLLHNSCTTKVEVGTDAGTGLVPENDQEGDNKD